MLWLRKGNSASVEQQSAVRPIRAVSRESELPLSYAQQRLWFLEKISPEQAIYNVPLSVRLSGTLDVTALEQTLQQIIDRHEVLRTRFVEVKGEPRQQIVAQQEFRIKVIDLSHLQPAKEKERPESWRSRKRKENLI